MFERHHEPLLPLPAFLRRVARFVLLDLVVLFVALSLGVAGYHYFEGLNWLDALINASMIDGGMGPVSPLQTAAGKVFASFYALLSGLVFIGVAGILLTPFVHRLLHQFHLDPDTDNSDTAPEPKAPRRPASQ